MSINCCSTSSDRTDVDSFAVSKNSAVVQCPQCNVKGRVIGAETVKAMVIDLSQVQSMSYRFCKSSDCEVVYFAEETPHYFADIDLRERVHQKHPKEDDVLVCYCFQHTPNSIRLGIVDGCTDVADRITALTKAGRCACEIRNPQGTCCLGNVRQVVKNVLEEH